MTKVAHSRSEKREKPTADKERYQQEAKTPDNTLNYFGTGQFYRFY